MNQRARPQDNGEDDASCSKDRALFDDAFCLDPLARQMAIPWGIGETASAAQSAFGFSQRIELARTQVLEQMFPSVVRKAAWDISRDRCSATLLLEIGFGSMDGATVLIRADPKEVHIELDAPPGIDREAWMNRLRLRLASQGLTATVS
jgi:hypothetical protein